MDVAMVNDSQKLLVVDDLEDWRSTLSGLLRDNGYIVEVAGSIEEAIDLLKNNSFELALLDLRLDETDENNIEGIKFAETIKQQWPMVKVVMITGYGTPEIIRMAREPNDNGIRLLADYIRKDETNKLVEVVHRVLTT
jgi:CheY-like chemotaxis protein